jgi:hypothetical protein
MVDITIASQPSLRRARDVEGNPRVELRGPWNLRTMQGMLVSPFMTATTPVSKNPLAPRLFGTTLAFAT